MISIPRITEDKYYESLGLGVAPEFPRNYQMFFETKKHHQTRMAYFGRIVVQCAWLDDGHPGRQVWHLDDSGLYLKGWTHGPVISAVPLGDGPEYRVVGQSTPYDITDKSGATLAETSLLERAYFVEWARDRATSGVALDNLQQRV
jgi:hypothetical protein